MTEENEFLSKLKNNIKENEKILKANELFKNDEFKNAFVNALKNIAKEIENWAKVDEKPLAESN